MEHIRNNNLHMTRYPVGEHMSDNMPIINEMAKIVQDEYKGVAINIWCRGSSGSIIATVIAVNFMASGGECKICHIKKKGESAHSKVPTHIKGAINIMVDDFICSGDTVQDIYEAQQRFTAGEPMDSLIISGGSMGAGREFSQKLRKIFSQ